MVEIVLFILKILGLIMVSLLTLVLLLILLILFVPIFYDIKVLYQTSAKGEVKVSWLPFSLYISYDENVRYYLKLFSKVLYDSLDTEEEVESSLDIQEVDTEEKETSKSTEFPVEECKDKSEVKELKVEVPKTEYSQGKQFQDETKIDEKQKASSKIKEKETKKSQTEKRKKEYKSDTKDKTIAQTLIEGIQEKLVSFKVFVGNLSDKKDKVTRILQSRKNKILLTFLWKKTKAILKCLAPRKYKGYIGFGFEDPATTGNALVYISLLYPWFGKDISVIPDFEKANMDIHLDMKGHFGLYYILYWLISLFVNKDFRILVEAYRQKKIPQYLLRD